MWMALDFFNAWTSVMPKPNNNLLCIWHIDKNWRKQLQKVNGTLETKAEVYKYIRVLLEERNVENYYITDYIVWLFMFVKLGLSL